MPSNRQYDKTLDEAYDRVGDIIQLLYSRGFSDLNKEDKDEIYRIVDELHVIEKRLYYTLL